MTIQQYVDNFHQRYKLGNATEHTFRGDLQTLIESVGCVQAINATFAFSKYTSSGVL